MSHIKSDLIHVRGYFANDKKNPLQASIKPNICVVYSSPSVKGRL